MGRIRQIRRDDGSLVPFRERKIADAVEEALKVAGTGDRVLADELAGVVTLFLENYHAESVPSLGDIEEMMGRVLRETGHTRAARALEELQHERRRLREELVVRSSGPGSGGGAGDEGQAYDRAVLVRGLVEDREIPEVLGEEIAAAVEQRLIRSGLKSVTTAFLRELVEYELRDRGIEPGAGDERLPGPRRAEFQRALRGEAGPGLPERRLSAPGFHAFALGGIHSPPVAKAHLESRIHVHGLDDPLRVERVRVPAALLLDAGAAHATDALLRIRRLLDGVRDHVRSAIELWDLAYAVARSALPDAGPERLARDLLLAIDWRDAWDRPAPPRTELAIPIRPPAGTGPAGARFLDALAGLVLQAAEPAHRLPVTLIAGEGLEDPEEDGVLAGILDTAAARAETFLAFPRGSGAPARGLPVPLQASLGRVALNLPLAFADGAAPGPAGVPGCLEEPARLALTAFTERFWHQRQGLAQGLHGIVVRLGGPGQVQVHAEGQEVDLEVWGLSFALDLLVRRDVIRAGDRPATAARLLAFLDYVLGEERHGVRFRVRLGGTTDRDVRRRFLSAVESAADGYGLGDVQDLLRDGATERTSLPVVVPFLSPANAALLGSPFSERLSPGLTLPLAAFGGSSPGKLLRRVRDETRLGLLALAPRRPADDIFEVQEELF